LLLKLQAKADYALTDDTKAIEAKLNAAPFETTIRMAVVADGPETKARSETALNQIAEVLGQYHQRTSHHVQTSLQIGAGQQTIAVVRSGTSNAPSPVVHPRAPRFAPPPDLLLPIRTWRMPDILTSIEVAGFWHPPSAGLGSLVRWLPCK